MTDKIEQVKKILHTAQFETEEMDYGKTKVTWVNMDELAQQIDSLYTTPENEELEELQTIVDLRYKADMRAITMWREGHPERDLRQPDHADMVCWLLDRLDEFESTLKQEIMEHLPQELNQSVSEELLLSDEDILQAWNDGMKSDYFLDGRRSIAKAQLSHCKTLIEAQTREKVLKEIDYLLMEHCPIIVISDWWSQFKSGKPIEE